MACDRDRCAEMDAVDEKLHAIDARVQSLPLENHLALAMLVHELR